MSRNWKSVNVTGNLGFPSILCLIFITLKLTGHITWSWWWVTFPMWGTMAIIFFLVVFLAFCAALASSR